MIALAVPPQWRPAPHPTARADAAKALKLGHYPIDSIVAGATKARKSLITRVPLYTHAIWDGIPNLCFSAGLTRQRKRQVQLHPVVHHLRRDAAALAAFKADQAITFHRSERAREVRLGLAGDTGQFVERAGRLVGDDAQQVTIPGGEDLGERLGRGEPDLGLIGRPAESFDFVTCQFGLHHIPDKGGMISAVFRVLRPGG